MVAPIGCSRPAIIRQGRVILSAILIAAFSAGCGGGGSAESGFRLTVDVVNPGETMVVWSSYPESNTYQVVRDGQQIINAKGDIAYIDRGLLAGVRYCYVVRARGPSGTFDASSNEVCVTMPKFGSRETGAVGAVKGARIAEDFIGLAYVSNPVDPDVLVA